jgi:ABC-2 type transport system permease protein
MKKFIMIFIIETKLFLRDFTSIFFMLGMPIMLLLLFGSIYGNTPSATFGGLGSVDVSVPADFAIIIVVAGIMSLPMTIVSYREKKILKRFRGTPMSPAVILFVQFLLYIIVGFFGAAILIILGKLIYSVRIPGSLLQTALAFLLSCASIFSLGFFLASIVKTFRSVSLVAFILYFPMIFLSGATVPRELLPKGIYRVSQFLPLTHVVNLLRGIWAGQSWGMFHKEIIILVGVMIVSVAISIRIFRWE